MGLRAKRAGMGRIPDPACGGGGCERSEQGWGESPTPLAGEGAASEASEGGGESPTPLAGEGAASEASRGRGEFGCRMSTAKYIIYFSLNNNGSVIPFCSFPNIKSHMKFLA